MEENAHIVTFVFPDSTGTRTGLCSLAWRRGADVYFYFHQTSLREAGVLAMAKKVVVYNKAGQKVRKSYCPVQGDVIVLRRVKNTQGR